MGQGALDGLLVVAIEQAVAAPLCTLKLADGGARVIKIERETGDTARHYDSAVHGTSAYFAWLNRGKQSAALDIKHSGDRAVVEAMLARADVLVQNLAPGAAARLGLDAASACARHPRLIGVDICGYGQDTDAAPMRAYDMLVQAESGLAGITGTPEGIARVGVSVADIATGMNAHAAILEALIARGRTGQGVAIEIAMFDALADWMAVPLLHLEHLDRETGRHGLAHAAIQPYAAYPCADGEIVIAVQSPAEWLRLCETVLGQRALASDPRFATNPARVANRVALAAIIAADFRRQSRAEVITRLEAAQIAWGRVSSLPDVRAHPALRQIAAQVPGGGFTLPRPAGRTGDLPGAVPGFGADTAAIRHEFAA
jgi:crotonobetainyl-CoA:carnitine CoA-transferase CaiB-like acyl-CoA transferase